MAAIFPGLAAVTFPERGIENKVLKILKVESCNFNILQIDDILVNYFSIVLRLSIVSS